MYLCNNLFLYGQLIKFDPVVAINRLCCVCISVDSNVTACDKI